MPAPSAPTGGGFDLHAVFKESKVHANVAQEVIVTTEDRATLCLMRHRSALETKSQWVAPASLLAAIVATLVTSEFHDFLRIPREVWHALFLVTLFLSVGWLIASLIRIFMKRKARSIEAIIAALKQQPNQPDAPQPTRGMGVNLMDRFRR